MEAVLLYDGECSLCAACAEWANARGVRVNSWQSWGPDQLGRYGLNSTDVESAAWYVSADGHLARGHQAVARTLQEIGGWYGPIGRTLLLPPFSWVARIGYRWVADNRQKMGWLTTAIRSRS